VLAKIIVLIFGVSLWVGMRLVVEPNVISRRVVLFAGAKDLVGAQEVTLEFKCHDATNKLTAQKILSLLGELYPSLLDLLPSCRLAVDCEYVSGETLVDLGADEIAVIPPVSGG
jgi:molybdopterin converting factor small subunit